MKRARVEVSQASGSELVATKNQMLKDVGTTFDIFQFDPTAEKALNCLIPQNEVWRDEDRISDNLKAATIVSFDLKVFHENPNSKQANREVVHQHHLKTLASFLPDILVAQPLDKQLTLEKLGCGYGVATSSSSPDGYFFFEANRKKVVCGIYEVKNDATALKEMIGQAYAAAINVGKTLVPRDPNCGLSKVIPFVCCNGRSMSFHCVLFLPPSDYPIFYSVSPLLDLSDRTMLRTATRFLCKLRDHIEFLKNNFQYAPSSADSYLDEARYFLKPIQPICQLFSDRLAQTAIRQYFAIQQALHESEVARPYVAFPYGLRFPLSHQSGESDGDFCLIFDHLSHETNGKFNIGLPPTPDDRVKFLAELRKAVEYFHDAGVVHMDLYLSNIMWKKDPFAIKVQCNNIH